MTPGWTLEPDEVLALPLDQLALLVLADVAEEQTAGIESNDYNWLLAAQNHYRPGPALWALGEAWAWLRAHLLVIDQPVKGGGWILITRRGLEVLQHGIEHLRAIEKLDVDLHPLIESAARRQFLMGEYELAVFAAMRQVEIRARSLSGLSDSVVARDLMHNAFGRTGALRVPGVLPAEQDSTMELFAGAMGVLRNPVAHRTVDYDNPTHAAEAVVLASLLMRMLDGVSHELAVSE